jgi:hypothetical protein
MRKAGGTTWRLLVISLFACGVIAGIDRLYWVNSGDGLAGWIGPALMNQAGLSMCGDEGAEVKYRGVQLHYRCGRHAIWPMYLGRGRHGYSPQLQMAWEDVQPES